MTKKIFIDKESGEEYEQTSHDEGYTGDIIIKPIKKAEEKYPYTLKFYGFNVPRHGNLIQESFNFNPQTGMAVAEAIKATLIYINAPKVSGTDLGGEQDRAMMKARKLIQEDIE